MAWVLYVEDDPEQRELLSLLLSGLGYTVRSEDTVQGGLSALAESPPDVLLCDYNLPDGDALPLLRQAAQVIGAPQVVVLSAAEQLVLPQGIALLRKPVDLDELYLQLARRVPAAAAEEEEASPPKEAGVFPPVELTLYVAGAGGSSVAARRNLRAILQRFEPESLAVETVDLLRNPDGMRSGDRVLFTPALVVRHLGRCTRIIGDLRDQQVVEDALAGAGVPMIGDGASPQAAPPAALSPSQPP